MLFGAMAIAAGFEVRIARLSDRSDVFFDPSFANSYFMNTFDVAVKVGNQWRFFDPGNRYVPFGMFPGLKRACRLWCRTQRNRYG